MTRSATGSLVSALLLGALLAASGPAAADLVTDSSIGSDDLATKHPVDRQAGKMANWSEGEQAALLASAVAGVKNVKSELATRYAATRSDQREFVHEIWVQPETGMTKDSDAILANEIRDSFRRHGTTSPVADRIRVGVNDGVATLTGDLDTWHERLEAGRVAFATEGVWKVDNRLTVKGHDYEWEKWEYDAPYYYEELFPNVG